ncbi:hypothetical protein E3J20_03845 [Candidatus Bathyarchaeota archaeon]|nr:MAG: hypothetical protein E3J20_03845 [Candidatus Bathyarchaeota archaeon]
MQPDKKQEPKGRRKEQPRKEITIPLDDDLDRYFKFLEKIKLVKQKEDAALAALRIYKKLNMHDWLPYVYRSGNERLIILGQGMLHDIFTSLSEPGLYDIARMTALKRKVINPIDPDLDLKEPDNWDVIFNELENMGWGKFTRDGEEIMIEFLGVPIAFLKGYVETLFQVVFKIHQMRSGEVYVLSKEKDRTEIWR